VFRGITAFAIRAAGATHFAVRPLSVAWKSASGRRTWSMLRAVTRSSAVQRNVQSRLPDVHMRAAPRPQHVHEHLLDHLPVARSTSCRAVITWFVS